MRIAFVPQDFSGPGFYRCLFPMLELQKRGHYCSTPPYRVVGEQQGADGMTVYQFNFDGFPECDLAVFQMPCDEGMLHYVKHLKAQGVVVVGECDDSERLPGWHPAFHTLSAEQNPSRNREWRRRIFQSCDAITVATEALKREWGVHAPTTVLPNLLLAQMWNAEPQYAVERERVRVGWMGRSMWRGGDLEVLKPVIRPFLEAHPEVDFVAAGDPQVHEILGVPEGQRVSYGPVSFPQGMAQLTATMDVGLVPLARSTDVERHFNDCKSTLKGMEYAACGIPCVASPSEPYRAWVEPGRTGLLADDAEGWRRALEALLDPALRRGLGRAARDKVLAQHSIEGNVDGWESLYLSLIERRRARGRVATSIGTSRSRRRSSIAA